MGDNMLQPDADRAARIAARCKRIQEKLAAVRQGDAAGAQELAQQQGMSKTTQQLLQSSKRLIKLKYETQQAVTAVRVQSDEQESNRRQRDGQMRQDLRAKLLAEAEAAAAANAAISGRWAGVLSHTVPQDMFAAIEQQRMACEAVIASKHRLIADIRNALKAKDDDYVKLLKRQAADVDTLLGAMGQQLSLMTAAYREELENMESVLMQERAELLASNRKEVGTLLEARATAESAFTDKYLAAVDNYAHSLEELRHADGEEYQVLKVKLESDIAVLEQHLETMRATYQLNAEKLEYNYRVLLERDAENTTTINQQKRKLSRQHDVLLNLKSKYSRSDAKACEENSKLTEEYKRITEHFKDMQAKFAHFGKVDLNRYNQLWHMQQHEACDLVKQLLAADRVIHEQQLGWQWQPPDDNLFVSPHDVVQGNSSSPRSSSAVVGPAAAGGSSGYGTRVGSTFGSTSGAGVGSTYGGGAGGKAGSRQTSSSGGMLVPASPGSTTSCLGFSSGGQRDAAGSPWRSGSPAAAGSEGGYSAGSRRGSSAAGGSGSGRGPSSPGAASTLQLHSSPEVTQRLTAPHYYGALCLLVDEAGFLVEAKAAALIADLPANEARLVAAASIVRALGVTDGPGFDALMEALTLQEGAGAAASSSGGGEPVLVHPNDALLRLKQFVEAEAGVAHPAALASTTRAGAGSPAAATSARLATGGSAGSPKASTAAAVAGVPGAWGAGTQVVSRRAADREREYWERLTHAVGDKAMRVWTQLEQQLGSYHKLLVQRGEGLAAVGQLRADNEELRALLNQYLGSKINSELQIPPMAVL